MKEQIWFGAVIVTVLAGAWFVDRPKKQLAGLVYNRSGVIAEILDQRLANCDYDFPVRWNGEQGVYHYAVSPQEQAEICAGKAYTVYDTPDRVQKFLPQ